MAFGYAVLPEDEVGDVDVEKRKADLEDQRQTRKVLSGFFWIILSLLLGSTVLAAIFTFFFTSWTNAQAVHTSTSPADVTAGKAAALTLSPTSSVPGRTFDRFVTIWCENTDYAMAAKDPNIAHLAAHGISLTNYKAITHPSQPNYIAAVGGSQHGIFLDLWAHISSSSKTIVHLLDAKKISWGEYQEDMPYSGFEGDYVNQQNGKNDYVRKHNPLISYESVTSDAQSMAKIKNFTLFYDDLKAKTLPQWMFITPNMTNNGHDSSITVAGAWSRNFIEPLLANKNFSSKTLVLLTFDETESYFSTNRVFSLLLGDAIPSHLKGTTDDTAYNHYSIMSTVERNWDLGDLGLGDKGAAPFY